MHVFICHIMRKFHRKPYGVLFIRDLHSDKHRDVTCTVDIRNLTLALFIFIDENAPPRIDHLRCIAQVVLTQPN